MCVCARLFEETLGHVLSEPNCVCVDIWTWTLLCAPLASASPSPSVLCSTRSLPYFPLPAPGSLSLDQLDDATKKQQAGKLVTVLNLVNIAIGAGVLSFPYGFQLGGYVIFPLFVRVLVRKDSRLWFTTYTVSLYF